MPLPPFAELARRPDADAETLAFAVAEGLWDDAAVASSQRALDALAERLLEVAGGEPLLVGGLLPNLPCAPIGAGPEALRLDRAVSGCPAHPLVLGVVAVAIGRRVGAPMALLTDGSKHFVARPDTRRTVALDPAVGFRPATVRTGRDLRWRCAHEVTHALLGHIAEEGARCGDFLRAVGAMGLRAEMVQTDDDRELALAARDGVRARLN